MISLKFFFLVFVFYSLIGGLFIDILSKWQKSITLSLFDPKSFLSTVSTIYDNTDIKDDEFLRLDLEADVLEDNGLGFNIDDTNEILQNKKNNCMPSNFGYSVKTGKVVFPDYTYPHCDELVKKPYPGLIFDYKKNIFTMECEHGVPYFILEPLEAKGRLYQFSEISKLFKVVKYTGPVKLETQDFVLGSCDGILFNNALHFPRFKKEVFDETSQTMKNLKQKNKPLVVLILTIDSYSRRHFFRKLPKTVEFLNSLDPKFAAFDFKLHNVFGGSSVENMVPIFSDDPLTEDESPREYDVLGNNSMWTYFKSKGFVTLFGLEDCNHYFPNSIGRYPNVDYVVRSFYCAAKKYTGLETEIDTKPTPRCVGPHMSHYYALNYTLEFSKMYSSLNQWIYLHLTAAHEASGQHASTLDLDLLDFLQKYLKTLGDDHELAIFLHADHGMRYGNWYQDIEAYQENKLPAFFLIGSKTLLDRIPNSYKNLLENTLRLTTKKDLRPTINFLADMPYKNFYIFDDNVGKFVNLFQQLSPLDRSCEDIGISPFDCSCLVLRKIKNITVDKDFNQLALVIVEEALYKMNYIAHTPYTRDHNICKKLSFNTILSVHGLPLNNKVEEIQIKFNVNESPTAVFEVFAFVGTHSESTVLLASGYRGPIINYVYKNYKTRIKIFGIKRKDKYAGPCEDLSRSLGIKSEFCVC